MAGGVEWEHPVATWKSVTLSREGADPQTNRRAWNVLVPRGAGAVAFTHRLPGPILAVLEGDGGPVIRSGATIPAERLNRAVRAAGLGT
jgi:hypothetical protein